MSFISRWELILLSLIILLMLVVTVRNQMFSARWRKLAVALLAVLTTASLSIGITNLFTESLSELGNAVSFTDSIAMALFWLYIMLRKEASPQG
jgi:hypothetical protein